MTETYYARPVFRVGNLEKSLKYYCDVLGAGRGWVHEHEGRPIIGQVELADCHIILDEATALAKPAIPSMVTLSMHDEKGLKPLFEKLKKNGARVREEPHEVFWQKGTWEFSVEDLDGNILVFWGSDE